MKLATLRVDNSTVAARKDGDTYTVIEGYDNLNQLLANADWKTIAQQAADAQIAEDAADLAPVVPSPSKVLCVGLNYAGHILEMGRELPEYPTVFPKFADTLTGPKDPVGAVEEDPDLDWEAELAIVIGKTAYKVAEEDAEEYIAGYTLANDISMRGWQARTIEWTQGKIWAKSTPVGPYMVTPDELDFDTAILRTTLNGNVMQEHQINDLVFKPAKLIEYLSTMLPLRPGDLILTGTPGGVGKGRTPALYMKAGDHVEVSLDGLGKISTDIVTPAEAPAVL
ncbi:fumarylacetoacetate hydrolase family protein [Micrococcoides hystricis]|uniref:Fumarylacetoacetate hydrolase family protein n=1 Tax=Micrococcoides hystricis TaxID=1572761 RepID=A0ABV6PEW0_9MICC